MFGGAFHALDVPAVLPGINAQIEQAYPALEKMYSELHQHPELASQEVETSARLAGEMRSLGFTVTEGVGKTGVVAIYRNGPGPTVMVRTDMDGLPMEEKTDLPYASRDKTTWNGQETFVAYSCGHDVHMAAWVGTARTLLALKNQWSGTLLFVAQPAEEALSGAQAMMNDGLYDKFGTPTYVLGRHNDGKSAGTVGYDKGPVTTFADSLEITFKDVGAHGSAPHAGIAPILMASRFVVDVQSVVSRERDPRKFGVVTVGAFQGGSAGNIIPDTVLLRGTIRSLNARVRDKLLPYNHSPYYAPLPEPSIKTSVQAMSLAVLNLMSK